MAGSLSRLQALLLGAVVLVGLALGSVGLFAIGSRHLPWSDTFHVNVGFRQIQGVEAGTRVRVQGIEAGEVAAVLVPETPGDHVVLRLRLDGRFRNLLRSDASAQIVGEGLVGGKVLNIHPGTAAAGPIGENATIASRPSAELADMLAQVDDTLQDIRKGQGALGKLMNNDEAYTELVQTLRQGKGTLASIQQDADAIKEMPIVRNYVKDPHKLLVRPDCERYRTCFAERDLFEAGQAMLTAQGREKLDGLVPWLEGLKHKGSEVVIAAYADPGLESKLAQTLTQTQSEAVCNYLINNHAVQKLGWFSRRKVTPLGCGVGPPLPEKDKLPMPRIEVLVFVPQG